MNSPINYYIPGLNYTNVKITLGSIGHESWIGSCRFGYSEGTPAGFDKVEGGLAKDVVAHLRDTINEANSSIEEIEKNGLGKYKTRELKLDNEGSSK